MQMLIFRPSSFLQQGIIMLQNLSGYVFLLRNLPKLFCISLNLRGLNRRALDLLLIDFYFADFFIKPCTFFTGAKRDFFNIHYQLNPIFSITYINHFKEQQQRKTYVFIVQAPVTYSMYINKNSIKSFISPRRTNIKFPN